MPIFVMVVAINVTNVINDSGFVAAATAAGEAKDDPTGGG